MELGRTARKRGRPRAEDDAAIPRDFFVSRALAYFASAGFQGFSVRELARQLGVSHGLINIRFGSKDQLWDECVKWGVEKIADKLVLAPKNAPVEDRLHQAIILMLLAIESVPALLQLVNHEAVSESDRLDDLIEAFVAKGCTIIEDLVDEGVRQGVFRDSCGKLVFLLVANGGGSVFAMKPLSQRLGILVTDTPDEHIKRAKEIADLVVGGLKN